MKMRNKIWNIVKAFTILLLMTVLHSVQAQNEKVYKNVITIEPLALINNLSLSYERVLRKSFSAGINYKHYYYNSSADYLISGDQLAPFARYYFGESEWQGFYAELKGYAGSFKSNIYSESAFTAWGGGVCLGFQYAISNNRITFDCRAGVKYYPLPADATFEYGYNEWKYAFEPGCILDLHFNAGFRF